MEVSEKKTLSDNFEIITARSLDEVNSIHSIWREMQNNEPYPVINADIDRYLSVLEASNDDVKPYIILLRHNGQPATMIIGRIARQPLKLKLGYKTLFNPKLKSLIVII